MAPRGPEVIPDPPPDACLSSQPSEWNSPALLSVSDPDLFHGRVEPAVSGMGEGLRV